MNHNYGLPYKGSKNTIAERIVQCLPSGGKFLDACCGGGAISHAAYLSGRYASVTGYDINKSIITLLTAVMVKGGLIDYENYPLITYEDFYKAKERWDDGNLNDAVVRYVASFGFNGQDYLWGKEKLAYKYLTQNIVSLPTKFQRREALRDFLNVLNATKIPYDSNEFKNLSHIDQVQNLQRIKMIEGEMERARDAIGTTLEFKVSSMFDIHFEEYDVIYFDPPYQSAQRRYNHIDFSQIMFKALLTALREAGKSVFVSEYENPDPEHFIEVANFKKLSSQSAQVNRTVTERLFFGGTADDYKKLTNKDISQPADLGQDDGEDAVCDDSSDGVRPAAGGEQCPETDAGIDSSNQSNQGVNNG
jgi:site-specific DNA-adenine methylase